jgi:transposase
LRRPERDQVELRAVSLDALLPADHRARLVWSFVERLDLSSLYTAIRAVEGHAGHPPADPRVLMALWLHATVEGIGSARALARLCEEHLAYQWLCGGVGMNHKTLSDFRVEHGALLERLLVDGVAALLASGAVTLARVAQDGVRVRAGAGAASFRRHATLAECRKAAAAQVARLRDDLAADPAAVSRREAAARMRAAAERQARVEAALALAEQLAAQQAAEVEGRRRKRAPADDAGPADAAPDAAKPPREPRVSTTDPEARVMKMADGGFRPAYNVQFASDTASGLIAAVAVDALGSDMGKLAPMSDQLHEQYGVRPAQHLVDGGFTKLADIVLLEQAGCAVHAPPPKPRDATRDRYAPRPGDPPEIAAWRQRMGSEAARDVYRQRAATAECINAQARNRGLTRLLVRSLAKVKAVALWHALAHNMARSWSLATA